MSGGTTVIKAIAIEDDMFPSAVASATTTCLWKSEEIGAVTWWHKGGTIVGVDGLAGKVVLPSTLGGQPVTKIGNGTCLFDECDELLAVVIPEGVEELDEEVFCSCYELQTVVLPSTVKRIGDRCFDDCDSLAQVYWCMAAEPTCGIDIFGAANKSLVSHIPWVISTHLWNERTWTPWTPPAKGATGMIQEVVGDYALYTVIFDGNGGDVSKTSRSVVSGEAVGSLPVPLRSGYEFNGWYTAASGGTKVTDATVITSDCTLFAQWTIVNYTITYELGGGVNAAANPATYTVNDAVTLAAPTRSGFVFSAWTPDDGVIAKGSTGNRVFVASWVLSGGGETCTLTFDGNGGTVSEASRSVLTDAQVGTLPSATRTGWTLVGWFTAASGGIQISADTVITAAVTFFAQWAPNAYSVKFDSNGGMGTMADEPFTYDAAAKALTACAFTRTGYTFAGWATSAGGAVMYADRASVTDVAASGTVTLYAKWAPITYAMKFNANGGSGTMANEAMTYDSAKALTACAFTRTGYTFVGWTVGAPGGRALPDGESVKNLTDVNGGVVTLYAVWAANEYTVKFNANGGSGTMAGQAFAYDAAQNLTMNGFTRAGCEFLGWAMSSAGEVVYADGASVKNLTATDDGVVNLYAVWNVTGLVDPAETHIDTAQGEVAPYVAAATVYDGYLYDGGNVVGSVQVKVAKGKTDKKSGAFSAKVTATVQLTGDSKKVSFTGGVADEAGRVTGLTAAGHTLDISLGVNGMGGAMDGKPVDGARNLFSAKDKEAKDAVKAIEDAWVGAVNVVGDDVVLSVTIAKNGKVKISGTVKGEKVSATSQLLVGAEACCVPVVITKKANLAFNLWLMADGTVEVRGADSVTSGEDAASPLAGKAGELKAGAKFRMDYAALSRALTELYRDYLPNGVGVAQSGTKWVVAGGAKAGKLALVKGTSEIDSAKSKFTDNMSGLKLTYKAKDGSFKGSFKAYALENGKIKSYTVNVTGVMIGTKGYGTATLKKPSCSFPITIE